MSRESGETHPIFRHPSLNWLGALAAGAGLAGGIAYGMAWGEQNKAKAAISTYQANPNAQAIPQARADVALSHDYENDGDTSLVIGGILGVAWATGAIGVAMAGRRQRELSLDNAIPAETASDEPQVDVDEISRWLSGQQ